MDNTEIGGGTDSSDVIMSGVLETAGSSVAAVIGMLSLATPVLALTAGVSLIIIFIGCVLDVASTFSWVASEVTLSPEAAETTVVCPDNTSTH